MENFLPAGYSQPTSSGKYYKFQNGENHFRILSPSITGWLDWTAERKPVRTKDRMEAIDPDKQPKHFWAFCIWDYRDKEIKILEITQATIQSAIMSFYSDQNWGNPMLYDIKVHKSGEKMETKYNVVPVPPKPLHPEIEKIYAETKIDLNELFQNGDPFNPAGKQTKEDPFRYGTPDKPEYNSYGPDEDEEAINRAVDDIPF